MLYRNMVMKMLKCKHDVTLRYSIYMYLKHGISIGSLQRTINIMLEFYSPNIILHSNENKHVML